MVVLEEWITQDKDDFKAGITDEWDGFDEGLRHEVYELLLDHDPQFKKQLFTLFEEGTGEAGD